MEGAASPTAGSRVQTPEASRRAVHLDDIESMVAEHPPRTLQLTGYAVLALLTMMLIIASVVKIDVVVSGTGEIAMDAAPIVLQPLERAIIRSIFVKAGDTVSKGQPLATLDATFIAADAAAHIAQRDAVQAHVHRLEAESRAEAYKAGPGASAAELAEQEISRRRTEHYASRLKVFDEETLRLEAAIRTIENEQGMHLQQLSIAREVEKMRSDLMQMQYSTKLQMLESQHARVRAEIDWSSASGRQNELRHQLESKKAERSAFIGDWRRMTLEDLARLRTDLARLNEIVIKTERLGELVNVRAPEDAVVLEVASRSAGSVLREAEPLMVLVPSKGGMIADISIRSSDIGYAKAGDLVRVKIDAFPYQRHGMLEGRLRSISERSYDRASKQSGGDGMPSQNSGGGATHRARIEITGYDLAGLPLGARVIPGMTVSAEILVGTRNVLSYFLDPIRRGFDEALREPS